MSAVPPSVLAVPAYLPTWLEWFYFLGRFFVDHVVAAVRGNLTPRFFAQGFVFLLILAVGYYAGRALSRSLRKTVLRPPQVDEAMGRLMGHLVVFLVFLIGFSISLTIFGTSIAQFATGLGLLTLALGFGMQNTVANLMGGVSLAVDKPFRPGDRIMVGEYWGTVQTIGLRSTKILTPRKEVVIVPNKIMEEREIWNYTMFSSEYRLDVPITIPYSADWRKAEEVLQSVADEHPNTLRFRPAQVVFRSFGESGIEMQLRAWLADVTVRAETQSDLLKAIRDRFVIEGIDLPYPHRSVVVHAGAPHEKTSAPLKPYARSFGGQSRILVVVDPNVSEEHAVFCTKLAKALPAGLVAAYIQVPGGNREDGEFALRLLGDHARNQRVWYKPLMRRGEIVETLRSVAQEERADLILTGLGKGRVQQLWRRSPDLTDGLRESLQCPIISIPADLRVSPTFVDELSARIREFRDRRQAQADRPLSSAPVSHGGDRPAEAVPPT
jgi:small-conductance mechanosensitive channel